MEHIRIPKEFLESEIMESKNQMALRLFLKIVGKACYTDGVQAGPIILKRGQWLRSNRKLRKDLGASPNSINDATKWLIKKKYITTELTGLGTVFTVGRFHLFQGPIEDDNTRYQEDNTLIDLDPYGFPEDNTRYREDNTKRYREDSNTNKAFNNKKDLKEKEIYNNNSLKNIKGVKPFDERDTEYLDFTKYNIKF